MFYAIGAILGIGCLLMIPFDVQAGRWGAVVANAAVGAWVLYLVLTRNSK